MWLLPWVFDGEALVRPRMEDSRYGEEVVDKPTHPFPRQPGPLAAPHQSAVPESGCLESEHREDPNVGRHSVVVVEARHYLLQPLALFRDRLMHSPSELLLRVPEFCPYAITSGLPLDEEFA